MDPSRRFCFSPKLKWNPQVEEYFVAAYGKENFARISEMAKTIESLRNYGKYQQRMFDQAGQLVRPGGVINHPRVGGPGLVGSYTYPDGYKEQWLKPGEEHLVQRLDPSSLLDTIGFFIAKFFVDKYHDSKKSDLKSSVHQ